jgi:hypothetical protein
MSAATLAKAAGLDYEPLDAIETGPALRELLQTARADRAGERHW